MPAYNLAAVIADNTRTVARVFRNRVAFELVVIDDGSSDGTGAAIAALHGEIPELRPVLLKHNVGKGAALRHGFDQARGSHVVFLDADLDLPPDQVALFFELMERTHAAIVIGSKQHPDSVLQYPALRKLMSNIYFRIVKLLFGLPIHDTQTGLKLFTRDALAWAFPRILVKAYAFDLELLVLAHQRGHVIAEAPVTIDFKTASGFVAPGMVWGIVNDTLAIFYRLKLLRYYQSIPDTATPSPAPFVSVVIALPAPSKYLDETLAALGEQSYDAFEIVILPDQPSARTWPANVVEIPTGAIRPSEKRNLGIARARGTIIAFIDDDAYPAPDWLMRGVSYFTIPNVAAVGGPGVTPPTDPWLAALSGKIYANMLVSGQYRNRYTPGRVGSTDDHPSCNLFVRREVLHQTGGFRTDFWPGEDTYLCLEIVHKLGLRIIYEPRALVFHHRRRLFLPHLRQIGRYGLHRGYFARHFPATSRRIGYLMPSLLVGGLVLGAIAAWLFPALRVPYAAGIGLYLLITLVASFNWHPIDWLIIWPGIVLTHLTYGVRFIQGWLTRRLPGQVRAFDHPSQTSSDVAGRMRQSTTP